MMGYGLSVCLYLSYFFVGLYLCLVGSGCRRVCSAVCVIVVCTSLSLFLRNFTSVCSLVLFCPFFPMALGVI